MADTPKSEFWKDRKPLENSQKLDALPQVSCPRWHDAL
jgi:hypothetical protein